MHRTSPKTMSTLKAALKAFDTNAPDYGLLLTPAEMLSLLNGLWGLLSFFFFFFFFGRAVLTNGHIVW
jgi:hypothetical protein